MITNPNITSTSTPARWRRIFCSILLLAAVVAFVATIAVSRQPALAAGAGENDALQTAKIAPWVMEHTANGQQVEFFVVLTDQADLRPAANLQTKAEKGRFVYGALLNKAQTTQGPILQWLRERGLEHRSFFIVNAILVKGTRQIAEALAARPDVARVEGNPQIQNHFPQPEAVDETPPYLNRPETPETIEPGINYTHAPQVWALGFTGQGIVVASADTGVRWTHNALKPHYRGWDGMVADHDYNWHDSIHDGATNPCGFDSPFPCDDSAHGSHTTGTMIGDDGMGNQIGMAPGAKWIGCRNMNQGTGTPARYIECMEWFLAPTQIGGGNPDPTKAPDITNNSWTCPASEGCSANTLQAAVEAQAAAGIMMVAAAGNSGSGCSTVSDPPSIYAASYTAGALNTGTDTIASFSSRGPVTADGSNRIKPDLSAPGTNTRSSTNASDSSYANFSGTSMATPHIAGAMALLWSAIPSLRHQINPSRDALNMSAVHIASTQCGAAGPPNNVYGWGRVDIFAAVAGGGTPTPTPTPTATATATATPTATATATATATPTAAPRPSPPPRPRPTPRPRP
jgi:subtilisin family serine protease